MSSLLDELNTKAIENSVPLTAHLDVTYRCNQHCVHCYLDHDVGLSSARPEAHENHPVAPPCQGGVGEVADAGEMSYEEIDDLLGQMAEGGVLFLIISGGEPLLRKDIFPIIHRARQLTFCVKLKTNATLIGEPEAAQLRDLAVETVQVSIYSHRSEVHDAITRVRGSLERSLAAIRFLRSAGLKVNITDVLMRDNARDYPEVQQLARDLGAHLTVDPTITPHLNGDRSLLRLNIPTSDLQAVMRDESLVGDLGKFLAPPPPVSDDILQELPCSAGHSLCYISPYGDVYPCVQFPLPSGNVRQQKFIDIWRQSPQLEEVRQIRATNLPVCSTCLHVATCSRCPGLAYMEGDMRGPSSADCEKSYARTGIAGPMNPRT